jgi:NagD protein
MKSFGFLLDMDGVSYRGNQLIPGADHFVSRLRREGIPFRFLTNYSQRTRRDVALKLCRLGLEAVADDVFTCAMATARFLADQKPGATAYVIGENGLAAALHHNGITVVDDNADYVVVGQGRTLNFEMIERALRLIEKGARLIATNPDATNPDATNPDATSPDATSPDATSPDATSPDATSPDATCPTDAGTRPGCGAIVAMLERATGREAFSVGKPSGVMMRMAQDERGVRSSQTIMVGDTMDTDILGGVGRGYQTLLVRSGHTRVEPLHHYAYRPDWIVESVAHMPEELFQLEPLLVGAA